MNVDPKLLFEMIAASVPRDLHPNLLVAGSVAAAYHHREALGDRGILTKDADVVVQPVGAIHECRQIALRLLSEGWRRTEKCMSKPSPEPAKDLLAIRLYPKTGETFFLELLGLPEPSQVEPKRWVPCELDDGWYGVPCFRFMALLVNDRRKSDFGIEYASPPLMALANLLAHPTLGTATMSEPIGGRGGLLRSAKDIGRVLALAHLHDGDLEDWLEIWSKAIAEQFPTDKQALSAVCGDGLRALLEDETVLEQAHHTTSVGLLAGKSVGTDALRATGERVLKFVVEPLQNAF